jgi:hypothetical protein
MSKRIAGPEIERLIQHLAKVPGLGPRSARRAALHLVKKKDQLMGPLSAAMAEAVDKVRVCSVCGNVDTSDPCTVCTDARRDGSLLVRAGAGTGKTVVALHRAWMFARRGDRVLVTTFVNNLPKVYQHLFDRLAPGRGDQVEFNTIHGWALSLVRSTGLRGNVNNGALHEVAEALGTEACFVYLCDVSGADRYTSGERFEVIFNLLSRCGRVSALEETGRRLPADCSAVVAR